MINVNDYHSLCSSFINMWGTFKVASLTVLVKHFVTINYKKSESVKSVVQKC